MLIVLIFILSVRFVADNCFSFGQRAHAAAARAVHHARDIYLIFKQRPTDESRREAGGRRVNLRSVFLFILAAHRVQ